MADYQSVLTRAVAKLPGASSADMRRAIYDRAREAMLTHLRGLHPRMPESDITREEIALNQAIALVEAKFDATEADPAKPTAAKPAPPAAGYPDRIEAGASPRPAQLGQPTNLKSVPSSLAESAPAAPLLRGPATAPPSPVLQHLPPARPPSASSNLAKVVPPADAHASRSLAVALSIVLSLAGAAIVMRQNPQDRVIAPLQHGREISPEPSAKITQHAQLSPTVANEPQGSQSVARSGETSQPAPEADGSTAPVASRAAMVIASQDKPQAPPDAPAPAATLASEAAPVDAPQRPAEAAPKVEGKVVVGAQPRTPNLHRIAKLSRRLTVAKTAATAPSARAETPRQPQRPGASTIPQAPIEPHTIAAPAAAQEPVNPMAHVLGARTGVLGPSAVEQTATKSGDWAIQFAKPKSEVEAAVAAARLNAKYAPALNGATIGVRKTQVNGETIYALRVAGLSKADAIALCVRVKGRDCSIIK